MMCWLAPSCGKGHLLAPPRLAFNQCEFPWSRSHQPAQQLAPGCWLLLLAVIKLCVVHNQRDPHAGKCAAHNDVLPGSPQPVYLLTAIKQCIILQFIA
jgi:hypothetical protein